MEGIPLFAAFVPAGKAYNLAFCRKRLPDSYETALRHLIEETRKGCMFSEWNDYGLLINESEEENETD
ncbi:MAG: hypothetical protein IKD69_10715 [Solobacterium sp.]|nr:hypothetical protein [Solobacterium sp.]